MTPDEMKKIFGNHNMKRSQLKYMTPEQMDKIFGKRDSSEEQVNFFLQKPLIQLIVLQGKSFAENS